VRGLKLMVRLANSGPVRMVAVCVVLALVASLTAGGSPVIPSLVAVGKVDTPKQRAGTARGKAHLFPTGTTSAKSDRKKQMSRRPKGAPPLERPFTPKVVAKTKAKRPRPPKSAALKLMPKREPVKVTGFDPEKSVEDPAQRTAYGYRYRNPDGTWTAKISEPFSAPVLDVLITA
jgi:hypothetical protein